MQQSWCLTCDLPLPTSQLRHGVMLPILRFPPQVSLRCRPTSRGLLGWLNLGCSNGGVRLKRVQRGAVLGRAAGVWWYVLAARGCAASEGNDCCCHVGKVVFKMELASRAYPGLWFGFGVWFVFFF